MSGEARSFRPGIAALAAVALASVTTALGSEPALPSGERAAHPRLEALRAIAVERPLVVAHRGDSREFPENTAPAFRSAVFLTAEVVEFDVQVTADGRWVCFHDDVLDRTTDAVAVFGEEGLKVADKTLLELRTLDAGTWKDARFEGVRIPTLEEALEVILPRATPLIERKTGDAEALALFLREREVLDRVVVQGFDHDFVAAFRRHAPEAAVGALGDGAMTVDDVARFVEIGVDLVHWRSRDLTVESLRVLTKRRFLTMVYTVNDDVGYAGAAALGIGGITTDDPNRLRGRIKAGFARRH